MPNSPSPATVDEYVEWASTTLRVDLRAVSTRNRYETNIQAAQNAVQESSFFRNFRVFVDEQNKQYEQRTGAPLLMTGDLTVHRKPFTSAIEKCFRINVLRNRKFPEAPRGGWVTPENWYMRFDDLIRSTLVCKFLDGPGILAHALDRYASDNGLIGRHVPRNTDEGYYAFHHYTAFCLDIADSEWNTQTITTELEIQLTTQLQEVLREFTHPLYEKARITAAERDDRWKWDYDTPRFRTSYLGHTLHMIEAVILQVRDSIKPTTDSQVLNLPDSPQEAPAVIPEVGNPE
jgi:hypothetical protein